MEILDGKKVSQVIKDQLKEKVAKRVAAGQRPPHLAAILVGHNGASETYVASKVKTCEELGYGSSLIRLHDNVSEEELLKKIDELNKDENIDAILVQLPLPS